MAVDRLVPTSASTPPVGGPSYADKVAGEVTGLWDRSVIYLSGVGGTANAITATATPALTGGYQDNMGFYLKPASNNSGAVTLAIGGGSAVALVDRDGNALAANDLVAGRRYHLIYDGGASKFTLLSEKGGASSAGAAATVRVATTANITIATALNNGDTLDGVTLATDDLVLVKDQSSPAQNGIYVVGTSPARNSSFDTYNEHPGTLVTVQEGTVNAGSVWLCTSPKGGTLSVTSIAFAKQGSWTQIGTTIPMTATATLVIGSIPAGYRQLALRLNSLLEGSASIRVELSSNGGSGYGGAIPISAAGVGGGGSVSGLVMIDAAGDTGIPKTVIPATKESSGGSAYNTLAIETSITGVIDTLRLSRSAGSFSASGSLTLWGIK